MALVEVVAPPLSDPAVVARAVATVTAWGKTPVVCADRPGFIVNRVNRPFTIEALRILESGAASVSEIDQALRDGGFPMGPFELMDLTGIDVTLAAATGIWEGLGRPDRLRPSPIQAALVAAGDLGRKTGQGFYRYEDGRRIGEAVQPPTSCLGRASRRSADPRSDPRRDRRRGTAGRRGGRRVARRHRSRAATRCRPPAWAFRVSTAAILMARRSLTARLRWADEDPDDRCGAVDRLCRSSSRVLGRTALARVALADPEPEPVGRRKPVATPDRRARPPARRRPLPRPTATPTASTEPRVRCAVGPGRGIPAPLTPTRRSRRSCRPCCPGRP